MLASTPLLAFTDPAPVGVRNGEARSPFLIICDHAGNAVPAALVGLGLPRSELERHIGYDIGILPVSEVLSDLLNAPLVFQRYSRLVVESNRRFTAPDSISLVSDGTPVPGNEGRTPQDRLARIDAIVAPYHGEIVARLDAMDVGRRPSILISMHSFTPSLTARPSPRPWQIGLCYGKDTRFTRPVLAVLDREPGLTVGRNQPYGVSQEHDYSIPVYGEERGMPYVEIEIRQDLIATASGQQAWAERLDRVFRAAYRDFTGSSL
jgi:predicted N-formylglutamate amidohydrolase